MAYCPNCGTHNRDDARFCNSCGSEIRYDGSAKPRDEFYKQPAPSRPSYSSAPRYEPVNYRARRVADEADTWVYVCSFCIPIVGLVLFIIWNQEKPNTAKTMGILGLFGFLVSFFLGLAS